MEKKPSFLNKLREGIELTNRDLNAFSDLSGNKLEELWMILPGLSTEQRESFYSALVDYMHDHYEVSYDEIGKIGLADESPRVREDSVWLLRFNREKKVGEKILALAVDDQDDFVREAAIRLLGEYNDSAELSERTPIPQKRFLPVLKDLLNSPRKNIRMATLESLAFTNPPEVTALIKRFLSGDDSEELVSALRTIERSRDERWAGSVMQYLTHDDTNVQLTAIMTAGTLRIRQALPFLYSVVARYETVAEELLIAALQSIAEIADEKSGDVLELFSELAVEYDETISEIADDVLDDYNMNIELCGMDDSMSVKKTSVVFEEALEKARDRCLELLEEKLTQYGIDAEREYLEEEDEDECECGEHHHHEHNDIFADLDPSRFRIIDNLQEYEENAEVDDEDEDDDEA